jgi:hydrogenase nickel incorporation protein HypA/HybF
MHELALCGAIAGIVGRRAAGRRVRTVRVRVGQLRQVVPETLDWCWAMVVDETPLAGSELDVERVAARLRCTACGTEHDIGRELDLRCRDCAGTSVVVVAGEEFLVTSIDVEAVPEAVT